MTPGQGLTLYGYHFSVYTRVARLALTEKRLDWTHVEVNPFRPGQISPHGFGRVPVLVHEGFAIYETSAILRYVEASFPEPPLVPAGARAAARMAQVQGIVDAYGYWPLVRQVYSHAVFRPAAGERGDPSQIGAGMEAAMPVLDALEQIAAEGLVLAGTVTLADLHLAPMIAAFVQYPPAEAALAERPALAAWWRGLRDRPSLVSTRPGLPGA